MGCWRWLTKATATTTINTATATVVLLFLIGLASSQDYIVSTAGQASIIPGWHLQSEAQVGDNVTKLSQPELDVASWYQVAEKGTIMNGLLANGIYSDTELFYSDNMDKKVDYSQFASRWYYRHEFEISLTQGQGQHYFLQTHGITSRADIYINGQTLISSLNHTGAYGGHKLDMTALVKDGTNVVLIRVYPTDYNRDFALGFVDWNPYSPDKGSGVWREVEVVRTGPVTISTPRIVTSLQAPTDQDVSVIVKVDIQNNEDSAVHGNLAGVLSDEEGHDPVEFSQAFTLGEFQRQTVSVTITLSNPKIWWPKEWGEQPLYKVKASATVDGTVSDSTKETVFGIRTVTSSVNAHEDIMFTVNGKPFQVRGGGYTPDVFLRFDINKVKTQFQYMLDMGLNTLRLEGKQEHPELYDLADRMGLMVLAGWECCDKWEAWTYNEDVTAVIWNDDDYQTANQSMRHEAAMMQSHPSMLGFLIGSDYWPDDRATSIYLDALHDTDWTNPIICSASRRGYPEVLGPSGMKMDGPYDWVPPNYWFENQLGAAYGFGSELGAGVGTPEISSLKRFLSASDMDDLWKNPKKGLYHMSTNVSSFYDRSIYNQALYARYGEPNSLEDYILKAQMMDYEATRAEYEAYGARWSADRPATGLIYWMLNNAWPSLHWNLFDYYLSPAGSFYGAKVGCRTEHVVYDYVQRALYLINRSLTAQGARTLEVELLGADGKSLHLETIHVQSEPNKAIHVADLPSTNDINGIAFLRLVLRDSETILSRNVYWLSNKVDVLDWDSSTWYYTPVTSYVDYTGLEKLEKAEVVAVASGSGTASAENGMAEASIRLENNSTVPAVFARLQLVDDNGQSILPVYWSDNYVTLWPGEALEIQVRFAASNSQGQGRRVEISGKNIGQATISL